MHTQNGLFIMLVCACYVMCCFGAHIDLSTTDKGRYKHGKAKLTELRSRSQSQTPYGSCWTAALQSLETGCRHLTDDVQHELTLKFLRCFLLKTGRSFEACDDVDRMECTRRMSTEVFSAYTEFFTHTQSICFYLQAGEWQSKTEDTIDRLTDSSAAVVDRLESAEEIQLELLHKQNDSIHIQQQLLDGGAELQQTLEESKVDVQKMVQEFQTAVSEQKNLKDVVFEVIHRVQALQSILMGEFTGFYSLVFYLLSLVIAYLLTSTPRTSGARFWLFVILSLNIFIERMIATWSDVSGQLDPVTGHPADENTLLFFQLRTCRKCFITLAVGVWCWMAYRYRDVIEMNHQMLMQVQHQNAEIKALIQTYGSAMHPSPDVYDRTDAGTATSNQQTVGVGERAETASDTGPCHDTDQYGPDAAGEPTPGTVQHSVPSDMTDTPLTVMSDQPVRHAGRRRQRRTGALSSSLLTPSSDSVPRYNLRSRVSLPAARPGDGLIAEVRRLAHVSDRNRVRALRAVEHAHNLFSSDED